MTIAEALAGILGAVDRPGDFFASGRAEFPAPGISVEGVGPISLPLLPAQAELLIESASRAPYGRGSDTIVDTKVRRTWQIEAGQVSIGGKHWPKTLGGIVKQAAEGLGVTGEVTAELYKLLVYDKGGFFVSHRDTEKAPGMFATLVLALPSQSQGGELVVRHKEREARLDLACDEPSEVAFAAFYADCVHEVLPVTAGYRVTLVFNLLRGGKGDAPTPPDYEAQGGQVAALLGEWAAAKAVPGTDAVAPPVKLAYLLEHAYTPAELAFDTLKGADAAVARLLMEAAPQAACDLHLALLNIWESGSAEHTGGNMGYRGRWHGSGMEEDASEFEAAEIDEHSRTLSEWRRPDGSPADFAELPIEEDEVVPPDGLDDMEPDEEHFHEATGNEGATFERTYARAALVLWPSARILAVLNQAGLAATLPYLEERAEQWIAGGADANSPLTAQARELAGHMLANWGVQAWVSGWSNDREDAGKKLGIARFLAVLTKLGDRDNIAAALDRLMAQQGHSRADNAAILGSLTLFPEARAAELLKAIMRANGVNALKACGGLLLGASAGMFAQQPEILSEAAAALVAALPGDPAVSPKDQWGRPRGEMPDAEFMADLAVAADRIDAGLATRMARHVLAWPRHFDPDDVLVPAVKRVSSIGGSPGPAGVALTAAATAHLKTRIALPLEAPRDWARPVNIACKCGHCGELAVFLADPLRESWTLRAAEQHRKHVEAEVRRAHADLELRTERKGSPHSLICKKNQASHDRRVKQRGRDLADLAVLSAAASG